MTLKSTVLISLDYFFFTQALRQTALLFAGLWETAHHMSAVVGDKLPHTAAVYLVQWIDMLPERKIVGGLFFFFHLWSVIHQ